MLIFSNVLHIEFLLNQSQLVSASHSGNAFVNAQGSDKFRHIKCNILKETFTFIFISPIGAIYKIKIQEKYNFNALPLRRWR